MKRPPAVAIRVVVALSLISVPSVALAPRAFAVPATTHLLPRFTQFEAEPNHTAALATPLSGATDHRVRGFIRGPFDLDYYSFSASAGDRFYAATMTSASSDSDDSVLDLIASDGTTVLESDDDDGSLTERSSSIAGALIPSTGTYYLKVVEEIESQSIRPYDLYVVTRSGIPPGEIEPNPTESPQELPSSAWVAGTVNPAADIDAFSLALNVGDTVFLSLDMDPERDGMSWNGRLGLRPFGIADKALRMNDPHLGSPNSEAFYVTVNRAGTYDVLVDEPESGGGPLLSYHLSVSVIAAEPTSCHVYASSAPQLIPDAGLVSSPIDVPDDLRLGRVAVDVELDHTMMSNLDFVLETPEANEIALLTDVGTTVSGSDTQMDLRLDDAAASPPAFTVLEDQVLQPEASARLAWTEGEMAGGTWNLVIRDDSSGDTGTLTSWRLIACEEQAIEVATSIYSTDFESDDGAFTLGGYQNQWEHGTPSFAPIDNCASGIQCWKTNLDGTYGFNSSQDLYSPVISLRGRTGPIVLAWAQRYQLQTATSDHFFVDVQWEGGAHPRRLFEWTGPTMTAAVGTFPATTIQESAGWATFEADISEYAGQKIELRFHLDTDNNGISAGVAIDDVRVFVPGVDGSPAPVLPSLTPSPAGALLSVSGAKTREGRALRFLVDRFPASKVATVAYTSAPLSARKGKDFKSTMGTVVLAPGEFSREIVVQTKDDSKDEKTERLILTLSALTGGSVSTAQATGIIKDND